MYNLTVSRFDINFAEDLQEEDANIIAISSELLWDFIIHGHGNSDNYFDIEAVVMPDGTMTLPKNDMDPNALSPLVRTLCETVPQTRRTVYIRQAVARMAVDDLYPILSGEDHAGFNLQMTKEAQGFEKRSSGYIAKHFWEVGQKWFRRLVAEADILEQSDLRCIQHMCVCMDQFLTDPDFPLFRSWGNISDWRFMSLNYMEKVQPHNIGYIIARVHG